MLTEARTRARLGPQGLDLVQTHLHPQDCQSCNGTLERDYALYVDDADTYAICSLHHPGCRAPYWNTSGLHIGVSNAFLTYQSRAFTVPIRVREPACVLILLNPGFEQIAIEREGDYWRQSTQLWEDMGVRRPSLTAGTMPVLPGVESHIRQNDVVVAGAMLSSEQVASPCPPEIIEMAVRQEGVLIGMTHAVRPDAIETFADLRVPVEADDVWLGWAPLMTVEN